MYKNSQYITTLAGAGTGKTHSLVENYIKVLLSTDENQTPKKPHEILALTFTKKAAHEMRLRIVKRLEEIKEEKNNAHEKNKIIRIIRSIPNAFISTFHGFCLAILKEYALKLNLNANFRVLSEIEEINLSKNILRPILLKRIKNNDFVLKNLIARFRLNKTNNNLGLIEIIIYFHNNIKEFDIKLNHKYTEFNFEKNLISIQNALLDFSKNGVKSENAQNRLLEINSHWFKFYTEFALGDEYNLSKNLSFLRNSLSGNFGDANLRKDLILKIDQLTALLIDYYSQDDELVILDILNEFSIDLEEYKINNQVLSYYDLLIKTRDLLRDDLQIRDAIKARFKHVLIDEYQDTNLIQEDLIAILIEKHEQSEKFNNDISILDQVNLGGASIFAVGDKKQSIYGFRGACSNLFDRLNHKFLDSKSIDFQKNLLFINRRSKKNILALVNLVSEKTLISQGYIKHEEALRPHIKEDGNLSLWAIKDEGKEENLSLELLGTAYGIYSLLKNRPGLKTKDITILVRRIRSAQKIKEFLYFYGIKSKIYGGEGFFKRQEIVDILAILKLSFDFTCEISFAIVLRSPLILLSDAEFLNILAKKEDKKFDLRKIIEYAENNLFENDICKKILQLNKLLKDIKKISIEKGLSYAVDLILDNTSLINYIGSMQDREQKWANIKKLRAYFLKTDEHPYVAILNHWQKIKDKDKEPLAVLDEEEDALSIMTIHQSKGLEFKVVVLTDLDSRVYNNQDEILVHEDFGLKIRQKNRPIIKAYKPCGLTKFEKIKKLKEEKESLELSRLLYVAMTRAKDELYIACLENKLTKRTAFLSLINIFLRAYFENKEEFLSLCPIEIIDIKKNTKQEINQESHNKNYVTYKNDNENQFKRLFSSQLNPTFLEDFNIYKKFSYKTSFSQIDGNFAHFLLHRSGEFFYGLENKELFLKDEIIESLGRSYQETLPLKLYENTLKACEKTLKMLFYLFIKAKNIFFEMHLISYPKNNIMIEGLADLIIEFDDFIGVIDFKSSKNLMEDPKSILQLFSYSYAISMQYLKQKPIKCALYLIGSDDEIIWQDFLNKEENIFISCL